MINPRQSFRLSLGRKLRTARESLGVSLADIAGLVGTSRAAIHDYEQGHKEPSAWVLSRLLPALKIDATDIFPA